MIQNENKTAPLPVGWKWVKLGETGKILSGGTPSTNIEEYWKGEITWITPADLSGYDKKTIVDGRKSITELGLNNSSARLMPKNSVLFSSRAPIGYVVISGKELCTNQGFKSIIPNQDVLSDYIFYFLKSAKRQAEEKASGTTFKEISLKAFSELNFPLPPLSIQAQIVEKLEALLSELDKGKAQLLTAQAQLKTYRQAVLKYAFEGKFTGGVDGWKWVKIIDIASKAKHSLKAGPFGSSLKKEFYTDDGYKIYGQEQVINGNADYGDYFISRDKFLELESNKIKPFDILISLVGTVGKVLVLPENCREGIINPRLVKISLDRNIYSPKFFKYYFESSIVKSFYSSKAQGTTMDVLNLGIIKTIPFPLPPLSTQSQIVQEIESRLSVCDKLEETLKTSLAQCETLRQSILKRAFEGKLV